MANSAPTGSSTLKLNPFSPNKPYTISKSQLLQGFTDLDGDKMMVYALLIEEGKGTISKKDGGFVFTPAKDFVGNVTITYSVKDYYPVYQNGKYLTKSSGSVDGKISFDVGKNIVDVTELAKKSSPATIQAKDYMLALLSDDKINAARWENADGSVKTEITYVFGSASFTDSTGETHATQKWEDDPTFYDAMKTQIRTALDFYQNIIPVTFTETTDAGSADFRFTSVDDESWFATNLLTFKDVLHPARMDIPKSNGDPVIAFFVNDGDWFFKDIETDDLNTQGTHANHLVVHELGHGLGLHHPHDGILFPGVEYKGEEDYSTGTFGLNSTEFTVMSYNEQVIYGLPDIEGFAATPMALDIAALQYLYGANTNYRTGIDSYKLNAERTDFYCIWDTGGIDSIEVSDGSFFSKNATIDLRAATIDINNLDAIVTADPVTKKSGLGGYVSSISGIAGGYTIAHGVVIENAIGGSGDDLITGNDVNNILNGGAGADTLVGGLGADTLYGKTGNDVFKFNLVTESGLNSQTNDTIMDFEKGDKIDLSGIDANNKLAKDQAFKFIGSKNFSKNATAELRFDATKHILYGSTNADSKPEFSIELNGVSSLDVSDFIL
jgi:serralysin